MAALFTGAAAHFTELGTHPHGDVPDRCLYGRSAVDRYCFAGLAYLCGPTTLSWWRVPSVTPVEAAVVFHDEEVAKEALQAIVTREDVAQASIRLPNGRLLGVEPGHDHPLVWP